jgi:hypothetical protein
MAFTSRRSPREVQVSLPVRFVILASSSFCHMSVLHVMLNLKLLSAAEECGLIAQDDILRSIDGCVMLPFPFARGRFTHLLHAL